MLSKRHRKRIITNILSTGLLLDVTTSILQELTRQSSAGVI
jgi:hypothetical protein